MANWSRQTSEEISIIPIRNSASSGFAEIEKELIVKFVKGAALFLVLCFAAFGVYSLFKKPPQIDVPESDIRYLQDLGVHIQDGQASESGLSAVLSDVQGVAPVGVTSGTSASSVPPSFLAEPAGSIADPFEAAPPVESAPTLETAPAFESAPPFEAAPRVASVETASILSPPASSIIPEFSSPEAVSLPQPQSEVPVTNTPVGTPASLETPPVPITQTSPPETPLSVEWESWDGPASDIDITTTNNNVTPPPAEPLQTSSLAPRTDTFLPASETIPYQPVVKNIRRISSDSPIKRSVSSATDTGYSSQSTVPFDADSQPTAPYTRTSVRQQLTFAPVKPEVHPNAPVVSFGHPKRYNQTPQSQEQRSPSTTSVTQRAMSPNVPVLPGIAETQSPAHEMVKQFVQSQQQLIDTGSPENIRHAFVQLSQLYEHNLLGEPEKAIIQPILDSLALKVIYAKNSCILEPPYQVKPGETVESIARDFNLTPSLLRKMNGLPLAQELPAGATLKVVYGQFDARISVKRRELTLLLGGLYAGRFSFSLPQTSLPVHQGEFFVTSRVDRSIVLNNGWILAAASEPNATIVFSDKDSQEIFDILSEQSVIVLE